MKRLNLVSLFLFFAALLAPAPVLAQFVSLTAGSIQDAQGNLLASGKLCILPVDASNRPIIARAGYSGPGSATGPIVQNVTCANIANGILQSGTKALDTSISTPTNVCLRVTITDNNQNGKVIYTAPCVQPTSAASYWCQTVSGTTTCDFDFYNPNLAAQVVQQTGPQGPTGPAGPAGPATVAVDSSTETGAAGTSAAVTNIGTTSNMILHFKIPQGQAGASGNVGGAQGNEQFNNNGLAGGLGGTFYCDAFANLTACFNAARAYSGSGEAGADKAAKVVLGASTYSTGGTPISLFSGLTVVGITPRMVSGGTGGQDLQAAVNGGTWIDCGGAQCFTGTSSATYGYRNINFYDLGFKNWGTSGFIQIGAHNSVGLGFGSFKRIYAIGSTTLNANDGGLVLYNFQHVDIEDFNVFYTNTALQLLGDSNNTIAYGNSSVTNPYILTYTKSVANGNSTKPAIQIQTISGASINLIQLYRPQVNSYGGGDYTSDAVFVSRVGNFEAYGADMEGQLANAFNLQNVWNSSIDIVANYGANVCFNVDAASYGNTLTSESQNCTASQATGVLQYSNIYFGTLSNTNAWSGGPSGLGMVSTGNAGVDILAHNIAATSGSLSTGCDNSLDCSGASTLYFKAYNTGGGGPTDASITSSWSGNGMTFILPRNLSTKGYYFQNNGGSTTLFYVGSDGKLTGTHQTLDDGSGNASFLGQVSAGSFAGPILGATQITAACTSFPCESLSGSPAGNGTAFLTWNNNTATVSGNYNTISQAYAPNIAAGAHLQWGEFGFKHAANDEVHFQMEFAGDGSTSNAINWVSWTTTLISCNMSTGLCNFPTSPTVPTPTAGDNSTKAATTAYVQANAAILSASNTFTGATNTFKAVQATMYGNPTNATIAAGAAAGTSPTIVCATSHKCTGTSGTITLTVGTSPATGALLTITDANTHTNFPDCTADIVLTASPYTAITGRLFTYTTTVFTLNVGTAPSASTSYTINYSCAGY
jgi:hypothetical protein